MCLTVMLGRRANVILGCMHRRLQAERLCSFHWALLLCPLLESGGQFWCAQFKKDVDQLVRVQGLENLPYKNIGREGTS